MSRVGIRVNEHERTYEHAHACHNRKEPRP